MLYTMMRTTLHDLHDTMLHIPINICGLLECIQFDHFSHVFFLASELTKRFTLASVLCHTFHSQLNHFIRLTVYLQVCIDIDECTQVPNGGCHEFRNCTNTLVSWSSLSLSLLAMDYPPPPLPLPFPPSSPLPPSHTHRVVSSVGLASLAMLRTEILGANFLIPVQPVFITVRKSRTASIQVKVNFTVR